MLQNLIEHDVSPDCIFQVNKSWVNASYISINHSKEIVLICMQFVVKELKKHAREELKPQIDKLYEE